MSLALANVDYDLHLLEVPIYSEWEIFVESLISLTDLVASADVKGTLSEEDARRFDKLVIRIKFFILNLKINLLPEVSLSENQEYSLEMCHICHGDWTTDRVVKLICGHYIHRNCLKMWLEQKPSCPLCRAPEMLVDHLEDDLGGHGARVGLHGLRSTYFDRAIYFSGLSRTFRVS